MVWLTEISNARTYSLKVIYVILHIKVKWSRYRPCVTQRVDRGIALLFHDRGTRRGWVVSSTPRPHFTPGKDLVPILQEAGLAPGPVWTDRKCHPHRDSIPDRPARSSVTILTELPSPCYSPHERVNFSPVYNRWKIHLENCVTTCFLCPFRVLWSIILCSKVQQIWIGTLQCELNVVQGKWPCRRLTVWLIWHFTCHVSALLVSILTVVKTEMPELVDSP